MGLEGLEILMEIEDEFGIKIPDEDSVRILTLGGMAMYVQNRLGGTAEPVHAPLCGTARAFYALRRAMIDNLGLERSAIRPNVPVARLVPYGIRWRFWEYLEKVGLRPPPLRVLPAVEAAVILSTGVVGVLLVPWSPALLVLWIPLACVLAIVALRSTTSFLPAQCVTVGDLARQTWTESREAAIAPVGGADGASVLDRVRTIVAEELRLPIDSLRPDTRFRDILP